MIKQGIVANTFEWVGYDPSAKRLEIEFNDKTIFSYHDVPLELHEGLKASNDRDSFFYENIDKRFSPIRIDKKPN